ncbi:MAG: family 78 glycoside hydrolase catalytic domain, partial [Eubacteriales bacterium]|nr:family 78 glycoside hydrolase catalytic domain [Eubacteriales bacterium]
MLTIHHLTCDTAAQPLGIVETPQFGWQLESDAQNVVQTSYRLQISADEGFHDFLYDSGTVADGRSVHVRPESLALRSATRYFWRVEAAAEPGAQLAQSEPASFVTGLLEGFEANFITAETADDAASSKGTAVFRDFEIDGDVEAAYAYCSALGVYQLLIDGKRATDAELAPGWTSYHKHLLYQTYDVTSLLSRGRHTLGGLLGVGWYKGLMGFLHLRNNYGDRTAFLCQLEIQYRDGRRQRVLTDSGWTGTDTPILFSDIYNGETYDARLGFHHQRPVSLLPYDQSVLTPQTCCLVRTMDQLPVQRVLTTPAGETVLDFGQNLTGFVRFTVCGSAGQQVELTCFEVLDKDGNVYTDNLRTAKQTIRYLLKGEKSETYQPHFTFQGFRYAHVKSWPGALNADAFTACVVHSDMEQTGRFSCSNPLLNQLWHNILWSLKGNFLDIPTDCPQRDERMGWTGDAQIFSATACYLMNADPFYRKWLVDVAADQTPEGGVPHIVPDIISGAKGVEKDWLLSQGTHSAAAWADAAVVIPWNLYVAYGDADVLRRQYKSMQAWVDFMQRHAKDNIWNYKLQFGDWVALDAEEGSYYG